MTMTCFPAASRLAASSCRTSACAWRQASGWLCEARWLPISVKLRPSLRTSTSSGGRSNSLFDGPRRGCQRTRVSVVVAVTAIA